MRRDRAALVAERFRLRYRRVRGNVKNGLAPSFP
jgi:hypothetical protein